MMRIGSVTNAKTTSPTRSIAGFSLRKGEPLLSSSKRGWDKAAAGDHRVEVELTSGDVRRKAGAMSEMALSYILLAVDAASMPGPWGKRRDCDIIMAASSSVSESDAEGDRCVVRKSSAVIFREDTGEGAEEEDSRVGDPCSWKMGEEPGSAVTGLKDVVDTVTPDTINERPSEGGSWELSDRPGEVGFPPSSP
jgi:hypothetical protein